MGRIDRSWFRTDALDVGRCLITRPSARSLGLDWHWSGPHVSIKCCYVARSLITRR